MDFKPLIDKSYVWLVFISEILLFSSLVLILSSAITIVTISLSILIFYLGLYLIFISMHTKYTVSENYILASQPFLTRKIFYKDIVFITNKYTMINTPSNLKMAMSNQALTIKYKLNNKIRWLTISPIDQQKFIDEVKKYYPTIHIEKR